ncbi:MAG: putative DNA binding domain-containing protein, partial [Desulfuromusa sp.]|nr:putative DNA binding domain-containing protein [Desulfuromusa sp.]
KLINSGESGTLEFKKSFGKEAVETIAAFANSEGGLVCIGVNNQGEIEGVDAPEEIIKDWLNQLKMATEPSLFPRYKIFDHDGHRVVVFVVQEYPLKPVACKGRYLKRHGASNHLLTSDEIVELKLQSINVSFDSFTVPECIDNLNQKALENFARDIEKSGRYKSSSEIRNDLEKLGFTNDGQLTRAAELLFGNHRTAIHLGRFRSRHTIVDDLVVRAPLVLAIDEAMEFMKKNMRLGYEFTGELKRKETWQFPLPVLRELLLNAIIHKDYRDPTDVIIKMFDEHVEFVNPGELFGKLKIESLYTDFYRASHRNKLLAEAFYLTGEVEKYGTGFIR